MTQQLVTISTLAHMAREAGWVDTIKEKNAHSPDNRLKPIPWADLHLLPKREYLVKGLLDSASMSVVYGKSNSGKTFLTLDIALHIAQGKNWHGMKVRQGSVVYIAAEGGIGLEERLRAFQKHNNIETYPPFYLIPTSIDMCKSDSDVAELIEQIKQIPNLVLIIVDTLSRALSGGDENSPTDMGALITNGDRLKEQCGAHVMFVHHSGKDTSKGARGHSMLQAAVDSEIKVEKGDSLTITAEVTKQRNGRTEVKHAFLLISIPLGVDEDGEFVNSCVLSPLDNLPTKQPSLTPQRRKALELLKSLQHQQEPVTLESFKSNLRASQITKSDKPDNIRRVISQLIEGLKNDGLIDICEGFVSLPDKSDKIG